ncbi:low temperature requirement protein LtrA [Haloactinospora alba]|uniref:Low temperature requirement protein LtrA n=1 Tax=Haloactinospora alba TaxID=405555 RepID=A0A543NKE7_9ACTN|nr:low temperature requirement protein A [Haloactinospora alba]TQN32259.1 low temperature requirement protein LtrA [Haloactinospora alba]
MDRANPLAHPLYRPMRARDPDARRGQTPLELLFDLAFSTASGFAAVQLTRSLTTGGWGQAVLGFAMVFFAIWWAWLNFSWHASAYDTDDGVTWTVTTLQILGACVLAAGVPAALTERDFAVITFGYAVMRLPLAAQWCRAAVGDPSRRVTCLRYAVGLLVLQVVWLTRLALPEQWLSPAFLVLVAAELAVPFWAQRRGRIPTNPAHMAGRYGRFTLTVAAQVVAAAIHAVQLGVADGPPRASLVAVAVLAVTTVIPLLWLYHALPHAELASGPHRRLWEYGHYLVVGAVGAVGAGARFLAETVSSPETAVRPSDASPLVAAAAVVVFSLWLVCVLPAGRGVPGWARGRYPLCALLLALTPVVLPGPLWAAATAVVLLLVLGAFEGLTTRTATGTS